MSRLPFSSAEFFAVFAAYNEAVWPAPLLLAGAAVVATVLAVRGGVRWSRWVWAFLAVLWAWTGIAYHLVHFTEVNPAANLFGLLFLVQGGLFFGRGAVGRPLEFESPRDARGLLGALLILYALVVYPLLGFLTGFGYFEGPSFGAPCPVVIYTFGMMLLAPALPAWLLVVPSAWALLGFSAVFAFGVVQDVGLPISAAIAAWMVLRRRERSRRRKVPDAPDSPRGRGAPARCR